MNKVRFGICGKKKEYLSRGFILPQVLISMGIATLLIGCLMQWISQSLLFSNQLRMAIMAMEDGRFTRVVISNSIRFFNGVTRHKGQNLYIENQTMSDMEKYDNSYTYQYTWGYDPTNSNIVLDVNGSGGQPVSHSSGSFLQASIYVLPYKNQPVFGLGEYGNRRIQFIMQPHNAFFLNQENRSFLYRNIYRVSVEWEPYYERFAVFRTARKDVENE